MQLTRRDALQATLGSFASLLLSGCGPSDWLLGAARHIPGEDPEYGEAITLERHVLDRCTFGVRAGDLGALTKQGVDAWIDEQLAPEPERDRALERLLGDLDVLHVPAGEAYEYQARLVQEEIAWGTLLRAVYARSQLREIVVSCWRDQFNIGAGKGDAAWLVPSYDRDVIRAHALGKYRDLLHASLTHPAMLWYLDGRTNVAAHPNENHGRELLELHSLGVGTGYTQRDVQEVARCLTGWRVREKSGFRKGSVFFSADLHDDGAKTVLGAAIPVGLGAGDVDRVVDLVAQHPATATRIARRLCARFISDQPPETAVAATAQAFTASGGDLRATVAAVLRSDAFRDPACHHAKLKRPLHWLASCLRVLDVRVNQRKELGSALDRLGETPYQHPTPDGYPERAEAWTGTLWWRWRIAAEIGRRIDHPLEPELVHGRVLSASESSAFVVPDAAQRRALLLASPAFLRC